MPRIEAEHMTMEQALAADGEKLRQMTGEDHGPWSDDDWLEGTVALDQPNDEVAPLAEPALDFGLPEQPAPVTRMANATWRILEEQRVNAMETIEEIDAQIKALLAKRNDARRAVAMCEAGQKGAE